MYHFFYELHKFLIKLMSNTMRALSMARKY